MIEDLDFDNSFQFKKEESMKRIPVCRSLRDGIVSISDTLRG